MAVNDIFDQRVRDYDDQLERFRVRGILTNRAFVLTSLRGRAAVVTACYGAWCLVVLHVHPSIGAR